MAKKINTPIQTINKDINHRGKMIKLALNDVLFYDLKDPNGFIAAKHQANYIKDQIESIIKLINDSQKLK